MAQTTKTCLKAQTIKTSLKAQTTKTSLKAQGLTRPRQSKSRGSES